MKKILMMSVMMVAAVSAQAQTTVSSEQIAKMLEQAKQHGGGRVKINTKTIMAAMGMHSCLKEEIGDEGMKRLGDWGTALNKQVKPLCAAGKRDEALTLQKQYAESIVKTPEYAGVRVCTDQYKEMLDDPMFTEIRSVVENPAATDKHICDYQKAEQKTAAPLMK